MKRSSPMLALVVVLALAVGATVSLAANVAATMAPQVQTPTQRAITSGTATTLVKPSKTEAFRAYDMERMRHEQVAKPSGTDAVVNCYPLSANYETGSCLSTSRTQTSLVQGNGDQADRAWMVFDVSAIPDGATVSAVDINVYVDATSWPYIFWTPITWTDPRTSPVADVYNDISGYDADGYYLASYNTPTTGSYNSWALGAGAAANLGTALPSNSFPIGVHEFDGGTSYYIRCQGWAEANRPYITVTYTQSLPGDVGVTSIFHPSDGDRWITGSLPVQAFVRNFDTSPKTFDVTATDGGLWTNTQNVTIPAGTTQLVDFGMWAGAPGAANLKVYTSASGDPDPTNDTLKMSRFMSPVPTDSFILDDGIMANAYYWYDYNSVSAKQFTPENYPANINLVGVYCLGPHSPYWVWPDATMDSVAVSVWLDGNGDGAPDEPPVFVAHVTPDTTGPEDWVYAALPAGITVASGSFWVGFQNLPGGGEEGLGLTATYNYPDAVWNRQGGVWTQATTYGTDEMIRAWTGFDPQDHDVSVSSIVAPKSYKPMIPLQPSATIRNIGLATETNIPVTMVIDSLGTTVYNQSTTVASLAPAATATVTLPYWTGYAGNYNVTVFTSLVGDEMPSNDTARTIATPKTISWLELPIMSGTAVYRAGGAADAMGNFYVVGGQDAGGAAKNTLHKFDPIANVWTTLANMPSSLGNVGCAYDIARDKIFVVGGYNGGSAVNTLYIYDVATNAWTTGANFPLLNYCPTPAVIGDTMFCVGGTDGSSSDGLSFYAYDINANTWSIRTPMPAGAVYNCGGAAAGDGKFFHVGGWSNDAIVNMYDPTTGLWTALPSLSSGRQGAAVGVMNGRLYVAGGANSWTTLTSDVALSLEIANPTAWAPETTMHNPLGCPSYAVTDQGMYVSTGLNTASTPVGNTERAQLMTPHDYGVASIVAPAGTYDTATLINPRVKFHNYHATTTGTFTGFITIKNPAGAVFHSDSKIVADLAPGRDTTIMFLAFVPYDTGTWTVRCSTVVANDIVPANDVLGGTFRVVYHVGPPPPGGWSAKNTIPGALVKDGGAMAYNADEGLIYEMKGNKTLEFYSYDPVDTTWTALAPIPAGLKPVKGGASMATGAGKVFVTKGNNTLEFYRYSIADSAWMPTTKTVPLGAGKKVKAGGSMAFVTKPEGDFVYLLKGYGTEFYKYDVTNDSFTPLTAAPTGLKAKYDKGSWISYDGAQYLYVMKSKYGVNGNEFYKYDVMQDSWIMSQTLATIPLIDPVMNKKKKVGDGSSAAFGNGGLYALKGNSNNTFWKYTPDDSTGTWAELETVPQVAQPTDKKKKVKAGAAMAYYPTDNVFFAQKGNKSSQFWMYKPGGTIVYSSRTGRDGVAAGSVTNVALSVAIGPNPLVTGYATLRYSLPKSGTALLNVFDVTGRSVMTRTLNTGRTGSTALDLRNLSAGVYLVKLSSDGFSTSQKLVVER